MDNNFEPNQLISDKRGWKAAYAIDNSASYCSYQINEFTQKINADREET